MESILFVHFEGSVNSKPPMNENANRTRRRKKMMLKSALVASSFRADAPKIAVTAIPSAR